MKPPVKPSFLYNITNYTNYKHKLSKQWFPSEGLVFVYNLQGFPLEDLILTYKDLGGGGQTRKLIKLSVVWNVFFGSSIRFDRNFKFTDDETLKEKKTIITTINFSLFFHNDNLLN